MTAPSSAPDIGTQKGFLAVVRRLAYVFGVYAGFAFVGLSFGSDGLRILLGLALVMALLETGGGALGAVTIVAMLGAHALSPMLYAAVCLPVLMTMVGLVLFARPNLTPLIPFAYHAFLALAVAAVWALPDDLPWGAIIIGVFAREFSGGFIGQWGDRIGLREPLIRREVSPTKGWVTYVASSAVAFALVFWITGSWLIAAPMFFCQWGDLANSLFKRAAGQRHSGRLFGGEQGGLADSFSVFAAPLLGYGALQWLGTNWAS